MVMLRSDTLQWHNQSFRGRAASRDPAVGLAALNLIGASREATDPLWPHPCGESVAASFRQLYILYISRYLLRAIGPV
jgi:hypothetical protein